MEMGAIRKENVEKELGEFLWIRGKARGCRVLEFRLRV